MEHFLERVDHLLVDFWVGWERVEEDVHHAFYGAAGVILEGFLTC